MACGRAPKQGRTGWEQTLHKNAAEQLQAVDTADVNGFEIDICKKILALHVLINLMITIITPLTVHRFKVINKLFLNEIPFGRNYQRN